MTNESPPMTQTAPYPGILAALVERLEYRKGWRFRLCHHDRGQGSEGLTLIIVTLGYDSYNQDSGEHYRVQHFMPVPPAAYNEQSWKRWLLDQCLLVERHECCEFFKIDGKRPYAPHHGPGNDPYIIFDRGTDEDARTMYTGKVNPPVTPSGRGDAAFSVSGGPRVIGEAVEAAREAGYTGDSTDGPLVAADPPKFDKGESEVVCDQGKFSGDGWGDKVKEAYPQPPRPRPSEPFRKG